MRGERGFTLLEMVVVLVIVVMLLSIAIRLTSSTRSSSGRATAVATARTIGDAINDFRKDHAGRPPVLGNARDWPDPILRGPQNAVSKQRYLRRGAPDPLMDGSVQLVGPSGIASGDARWALQYAPDDAGPGSWTITIRDRRALAPPCSVGGGAVAPDAMPERPC